MHGRYICEPSWALPESCDVLCTPVCLQVKQFEPGMQAWIKEFDCKVMEMQAIEKRLKDGLAANARLEAGDAVHVFTMEELHVWPLQSLFNVSFRCHERWSAHLCSCNICNSHSFSAFMVRIHRYLT
jgi:hypothetical protein